MQSTELTDQTRCVVLRSEIEIWITPEQEHELVGALNREVLFVRIEGNFISRHEIRGIFSAEAVVEIRRRKNGEWQDRTGVWRRKGERVCSCGNSVPDGLRCGFCSAT